MNNDGLIKFFKKKTKKKLPCSVGQPPTWAITLN